MTVWKPARSPHFHFDFQLKGQRYHGSTYCPGKRDALAYEARERQKAALPNLARPPITLDDAAGLYAEHAENLTSWPTIKYITAALVKGLGPNRLIAAITQRDLQIYFARRRFAVPGSTKNAGEKLRSPATINREVENARAIWRHADRTRYDVGEMPDWRALRLRVDATPPAELPSGTLEARLIAALADDAAPAFRFLLLSGWRRSEMIALRWADLDLPNRQASTRLKGGRTVRRPLTTAMVALIANQPKACPQVFTYVCLKSRAKRRKGQRYPLTPSLLRDRWQDALAAAKLPFHLRIHDLRHTVATRMLRATGNLAAVKDALQHRHISTTLRYAHVLDDDTRAALDAAANFAPESRYSPEQPKLTRKKA